MIKGPVRIVLACLIFAFGLTSCSFQLFGPQKDTFYETVLDRYPRNKAALFGQGSFLLRGGQYVEAIPYLKRLTRLEPENHQVWQTLGRAHLEVQEGRAAEHAFRRSLAINPSVEASLGLGNALMLQGDLESAREIADQVENDYGESASLWRLRGDIALMADNSTAAIEAYTRSLKMAPDQSNVIERLRDLQELARSQVASGE